jgi:hypothetical protein
MVDGAGDAVGVRTRRHDQSQLRRRSQSPTIARVPDDISGLDLNHTISFNDVGDAEAEKMGIGWNDDGTLTYSQPTE